MSLSTPGRLAAPKHFKKTVDHTGAARGLAHGLVIDATASKSIEARFDAAERRFGPVDIVVDNAGVTSTRASG